MYRVTARNVNDAFKEALWLFRADHHVTVEETRNGPARVLRGPLETTLMRPQERVLFWALRDANPFFHLMESLWMLAGRNDVEFVANYVRRMRDFSDDGITLSGAYGHRWRNHFSIDQIPAIIKQLRDSPNTRRAVLQMWDPVPDLEFPGKDVCCNLAVVFDTRQGVLNSYILNRSNDIIWGLYGANAVHFSILQEYIAAFVGLPIGKMTTYSVNAHAYTALPNRLAEMANVPMSVDLYNEAHGPRTVRPYPLVSVDQREAWDDDLQRFMLGEEADWSRPWNDRFFPEVAVPVRMLWQAYKDDDPDGVRAMGLAVQAEDWRVACQEWISRRWESRQ